MTPYVFLKQYQAFKILYLVQFRRNFRERTTKDRIEPIFTRSNGDILKVHLRTSKNDS